MAYHDNYHGNYHVHHAPLPSDNKWSQGVDYPVSSLGPAPEHMSSNALNNSPVHSFSSAGTTMSTSMTPSFIDPPSHRIFAPQYWLSPTSRNDAQSLPSSITLSMPTHEPTMTPMFAHAPLGQRSIEANMRLPYHGMALGHGPPPPTHPGHSNYQPWQAVAPTPLPASGAFPTMPSPTFTVPANPLEATGGHCHDPNLLSPYDYPLSRIESSSSMVSSIDSGMGGYYSPMSSQGGSDYFSHESDLRRVSATVGGFHDACESDRGFKLSDPSLGTIHLAHIHEGRAPVELSGDVSEFESDGVLSIPSSSPPLPATFCLSPPVKEESLSPLPEPMPSPARSDYTDAHASTTWIPESPRTRDVKPQVTASLTHPSSDRSYDSPLSQYEHLEDDGYATSEDKSDDDFRPVKRTRSSKRSAPRRRSRAKAAPGDQRPRRPSSTRSKSDESEDAKVSLTDFAKIYPLLAQTFPLFHTIIREDMTIHNMGVPPIGIIPNTVSGKHKCDILRDFYHCGKRKIEQLDAFAELCHSQTWSELSEPYRIKVRNMRRKMVERTENYKYTRRNILNKIYGQNNWSRIEEGMVRWNYSRQSTDPCGDLTGPWALHLNLPPDADGAGGAAYLAEFCLPSYLSSTTTTSASSEPTSDDQQRYSGRQIRPMPSQSFLRSRRCNVSCGSSASPPRASSRRSATSSQVPSSSPDPAFASHPRPGDGGGATSTTVPFSNLALSPSGEANPRFWGGSRLSPSGSAISVPARSTYDTPLGQVSPPLPSSPGARLIRPGSGYANSTIPHSIARPMPSRDYSAPVTRARSQTSDSDTSCSLGYERC